MFDVSVNFSQVSPSLTITVCGLMDHFVQQTANICIAFNYLSAQLSSLIKLDCIDCLYLNFFPAVSSAIIECGQMRSDTDRLKHVLMTVEERPVRMKHLELSQLYRKCFSP